jgi:hypothetical protein
MLRTLLFAAAAVFATSTTATVKDCSSGTSEFTVRSLDFSPSAPVPGENGTLLSVYEVPVQVDGGKTRYSCTLNGLPVYDETTDLCSQTTCPIAVGTHSDTSISPVPSASGKVVCKIDWRDEEDTQLLCIQMTLQLSMVEAKQLRGAKVDIEIVEPLFHTHDVRAFSDLEMCPRVVDFDNQWTSYQIIADTSSKGSSSFVTYS